MRTFRIIAALALVELARASFRLAGRVAPPARVPTAEHYELTAEELDALARGRTLSAPSRGGPSPMATQAAEAFRRSWGG